MAANSQEDVLRDAERHILRAIVDGRPLGEILDLACHTVETTIEGALCSVRLVSPCGKRLIHGAAPSLPGAYSAAIDGAVIDAAAGPCGTAAHTGETVIVEDITTDPLWVNSKDLVSAHGLRACWSVPLKSKVGGVLGTFATYHRMPYRPAPQALDVAGRLAATAAVAIQRKLRDEALIAEKEKAEAVSRAKSEFLANMSHELRTPLNAILGFSEAIDRQLLDAGKTREYAHDIHRSGRQLLDLINDVLDVARIESGMTRLNRQRCDVAASIAEQVDLVRYAFAEAAEIMIIGNPACPDIFVDTRAFRQVVLNIVGNAAKFTPPTGRIVITMEETAPGLHITVADTGPGIASEALRDLGQPFRSGETRPGKTAHSWKYGGTGLGLYISRGLLKAHDGTLEIVSKLGEGTKVTISLPEEAVMRAGQLGSG